MPTFTEVQVTPKVNGGSAAALVMSFSAPPALGNAIVVPVIGWNGAFLTCTDNYGNTYDLAAQQQNGSGSLAAQFLCHKVTATGAAFTITVTHNTDAVGCAIELTGFPTFLIVDQFKGANGSSNAPATGATLPLEDVADYVVACHANSATQASITVESVTPAWSQKFESLPNTFVPGEADSRELAAVGATTSASWTLASSAGWAALVVAYRAALPGVYIGGPSRGLMTRARLFAPTLTGTAVSGQRLYPNHDYPIEWLTTQLPITPKGGWNVTNNSVELYWDFKKRNEFPSSRFFTGSATGPHRYLHSHGVTPRLAAQTISGTVNTMYFGQQGADLNCFVRLHITVLVGDTDVVRGTLLNQFEDTTYEFASTLTAQRLGAPATLTPVAALAGDRIEIEIGHVQNTGGTSGISCVASTKAANNDAIAGTTNIQLNQFIEFSNALVFQPSTAPNDACETALVVGAFPYANTFNTFNSLPESLPDRTAPCSNWGYDTIPLWWKIVVPAGEELHIHTEDSEYPTLVSLWTGTCPLPTAVGSAGCANSPTAESPLVYGPTSGQDYYLLVQRDVYPDGADDDHTGPGGLMNISISLAAGGAPPHGCESAIPVTAIPFTLDNIDTTELGADVLPTSLCGDLNNAQWFSYTPTTDHRLHLSAQGTTYEHILALFTGPCPDGPWVEKNCASGWPDAESYAKISYAVTAGVTYWIVLASVDPGGGIAKLFAGDSHALGFVRQGSGGALEWQGNFGNFFCNGQPPFLSFLPCDDGLMEFSPFFSLKFDEFIPAIVDGPFPPEGPSSVSGNGSCSVGGFVVHRVEGLEIATRPYGSGTLEKWVIPPLPAYTEFPIPEGFCQVIDSNPESPLRIAAEGHWNGVEAYGGPIPDLWSGPRLEDPAFQVCYGTFSMRFRLSSIDDTDGTVLADGYAEVTWNGPGVHFGTARKENFVFVTGGSWEDDPVTWNGCMQFHPGLFTERIYVRGTDEYSGWNPSASQLIYYRDFTVTPATPEELFTDLGGVFQRIGDIGAPTPIWMFDTPNIDTFGRPHGGCGEALYRTEPFPVYVPPTEVPLGDEGIIGITWVEFGAAQYVPGFIPVPPHYDPISIPTPTYIPPGSIMVGGWGGWNAAIDDYDGRFAYLSGDGGIHYVQPHTDPNSSGSVTSMVRTSDGHVGMVGGNFPPDGTQLFKGSDLTVLSIYNEVGSRSAGNTIAADGLGNYYVFNGSATLILVTRLNANSEETARWDITLPAGSTLSGVSAAACVSPDGLTLFAWLRDTAVSSHFRVHKFSLVGAGSYVGRVHPTDFSEHPGTGSLLVAPDDTGDVIVAHNRFNYTGAPAIGFGALIRYAPDGTVVWVAGTPDGGSSPTTPTAEDLDWMGVAPGIPGSLHFLAWAYDKTLYGSTPPDYEDVVTSSQARYVWFRYDTGAPDNTRNFTPDDGNGFMFDSQIVVLSLPVGEPDRPPYQPLVLPPVIDPRQTYVWSKIALPDPPTYYFGYKEDWVTTWGSATRALSDRNGQYESSDFTWELTDKKGYIRAMLGNKDTSRFIGRPITVRTVDDELRRLLGVPVTIFKGTLLGYSPQPNLQFSFQATDVFFGQFGPASSFEQLPKRKIHQGHFPTVIQHEDSNFPDRPIMYGVPVPIIYGEITDTNLTDYPGVDSGDGKCPTLYVGVYSVYQPAVGIAVDYHKFVIAGHACKGLDELYMDMDPLNIQTDPGVAGTGGDWLIPGYAGWWSTFGNTHLYEDIGDERYFVIYGKVGNYAADRGAGADKLIFDPEDPEDEGTSPAMGRDKGDGPLSCSVRGIETHGDGTGDLILNIIDQYKHCLQNWILGNYKIGPWLPTPNFADDPSLGIIDWESFEKAKAMANLRLPGGYQGSGIIGWSAYQPPNPNSDGGGGYRQAGGEFISARELVARWNQSCDVDSGFNRRGQFMISMEAEILSELQAASHLTAENDILKDFTIADHFNEHFNVMPYAHTFDYFMDAQDGWRFIGEGQDAESIAHYDGKKVSPTIEFHFIRGKNRSSDSDQYTQGTKTAEDIVMRRLRRMKNPPRYCTFSLPLKGVNFELGDIITITHYAGIGPRGWENQAIRVTRIVINPETMTTTITGYDIQVFFNRGMILGDRDALPPWPSANTAQRYYAYLGDRTTGTFSTGEPIKRL